MILETYDKELHDKTLRSEGYENGKPKEFLPNVKTVFYSFCLPCRKLNISRQDAYIKLQEKYSLSEKDAEKYMDKHWKKA